MTQPTALFLADILEDAGKPADIAEKCAAELRRLHSQRKPPIADEALWEMWVDSPSDVLAFARRIEMWHGITGGSNE